MHKRTSYSRLMLVRSAECRLAECGGAVYGQLKYNTLCH